MPPTPFPIRFDLHCDGCGYNLRALQSDGRCPECGRPITDSIQANIARANITINPHRARLVPLSAAAGCTVDAILFLLDALAHTRRHLTPLGGVPTAHLTASQVWTGIGRYAARYFHDQAEALDLLCEWGITSSEALGHIIFVGVAIGYFRAAPDDHIDHFSNLAELEQLLYFSFVERKQQTGR